MQMSDLLRSDAVFADLKCRDKKHALRDLADLAAGVAGLDARDVHEKVVQRERLGSTAIGRGIAVPHLRIGGLTGPICVFAKLATPIEFEAHDDEPVDLLFLLLSPEQAGGDHLKALARISRLMRNPATASAVRSAHDAAAIYAILSEPELALAV